MKHIKNITLILLLLLLASYRPFGDINADYRVSITDLVITHRIALGMEHTALQRVRADLNRDGVVDMLDVEILHYYLSRK
jgi:hypothetical protein